MLPTPSTSHVNYGLIYEPAEDSFLILDTLSSPSEIAFLRTRFPDRSCPLVLEVGTGSGVILAFMTANASHIFGTSIVVTLGIDVSRFACEATRKTTELASQTSAARPGVFLNSLAGDLTSAIRPGSVDVLIFNPPYVPSENLPDSIYDSLSSEAHNHNNHLLALATDGGEAGMQITTRLLAQLDDVLSPTGVAYVLLCAQNKPAEVMQRLRQSPAGWSVQMVGSSGKKAGWEKLCVVRIGRRDELLRVAL